MRAIEITSYGGPEVLHECTRDIPIAGVGEVLIRVAAAGVNRPDVLQRMGHYPVPKGASDLPGLEIAGEIVGGDLTGGQHRLGDYVCALVQGGGYAEYCVAPVGQCLPVPKGLSLIEAASLPETYFTVWSNIFERGGLRPGETLLVHGGASGIGVAAIQMANAFGAKVFATVGSDEKRRAVEAFGAKRGVNYQNEEFQDVIMVETQSRGVDLILDMVAGKYLTRNLSVLADDGRLVIIGLMGGAKAELDMGQVLRRRLHITGSTLRARDVEFKAQIVHALREKIWPLLENATIRPVIHHVFPLHEAARAHAEMEAGHHIGKLVLEI
ncbi:NAD(P)H-quinone oxidoreductase [Undibacterium fentianense]|uniref:NAD(P)H-quinone oxidoreductase n=1 Tax=Undibacterium fentianense TaxID=2828728 RepID=A0A941IFB0_9BURK|nr:NAD(P)H-quinone oxidoreductase [Undibacterium fentianense]MBR7800192.1 NAD(P)H-quinone oxidoreductase [Undibacterium fentianense]